MVGSRQMRVRMKGRPSSRAVLRIAGATLALGIFLFDSLSTFEGAIAVLYVNVVMISARTGRRGDIVAFSAITLLLTCVAYLSAHGMGPAGPPTARALVSLAAIGIASALALQSQRTTSELSRQASLLDLSHDMIFTRDPHGNILFWNRAAEEVYGWSAADALGRNADALLSTEYPSDRSAVEAELMRSDRWEGELCQLASDGRRILVDSRWAVRRDEAGRVVAVLETDTDVTERKHSHAALVRSERRYRRMFETSSIGIVEQDWSALKAALDVKRREGPEALTEALADPEFLRQARRLISVVDVNAVVADLTGTSAPAAAAVSLEDILGDEDRTFADSLAVFAAGGRSFEGETKMKTTGGESVPVLFGITFPPAEDGYQGVLVFVVDNTERQKAQEALLSAQADLAHASRVATLGELTATIAHEVNQPLSAVITNSEAAMRWLRRDVLDVGEVMAAVGRVASEGRRASAIVDGIRVFLSKAPAPRELMSIRDIVDDATRLVEGRLSKHAIVLRTSIGPSSAMVRGDRVRLQQVMVNLLMNAAQAMADHPEPRILTVTASAADGLVTVEVSDTGPGLTEQGLEKLFQPFFTTKKEGMGMGLAICRSSVEAHDGRMWVENREGGGAHFRFTLPMAVAEPTT